MQEEQGSRSSRSTRRSPARRRHRWGRSSSPTCSAWTRSCTSPSTSTRAIRAACTSTRACAARRHGKLGAKTGGEGFYADGTANVPGDGDPDPQELADRFNLKALVEACLLVEEGVVSTKDADLRMMTAAPGCRRRSLAPTPTASSRSSRASRPPRRSGPAFAPPLLLRRLATRVASG